MENKKDKKLRYIPIPAIKEQFKEIPYHWKMDDLDIDEKIKELRKQIYELQNSRKGQPKLLVFEGKDGLERFRIFDGWQVVDLEKGLFCADSWHIPSKDETKKIFEEWEWKDKIKNKMLELSK